MRQTRAAVLAALGISAFEVAAIGCTTTNVYILPGEGGAPSSVDATTDSMTGADAIEASTDDSPARESGGDAVDSDAVEGDAPDGGVPSDGAPDADGGGAQPPGCTADPSVCPQLDVMGCTGWDCGDGGLSEFNGQQCVRTGQSEIPGETAYACGDVVDGYLGDPAGNGCVQFPGNWCVNFGSPRVGDAGLLTYEYACPADGGPPIENACFEWSPSLGVDNPTGWCCNTHPTCSPWGGSPQCAAGSTYLGFGGAVPLGCDALDAAAPYPQSALYCCPVSTDGGPACQP